MRKFLSIGFYCWLLSAAGAAALAQVATPQPWERQVGKTISIVGEAQNAKMGAVLVTKQGPIYLKDQGSWDAKTVGHKVRATGTLKKFDLPGATQKDGEWSLGTTGQHSAYRLENFKWLRVKGAKIPP